MSRCACPQNHVTIVGILETAQHPQVDTSIPGSPSAAGAWLSVAALMNYEHMGTAEMVRPPCSSQDVMQGSTCTGFTSLKSSLNNSFRAIKDG